MARGFMIVQSGPSDPAREDEYNDWYSNTHISEVLAVPGITGARRYRLHDSGGAPASHRYMAVYEIEADDLSAPLKELGARSARGEIHMSDVLQLDPPPVVTLYELME